ncbi:MAG: cytochrome bc complex cytochrome b subunit [Ignavibacteria bacterium]|nr:cytochrome b N-terminal domain-containing protein [Ignavibacteria bacterium]MCC7159506.1 cytochrome bc complex cytochrome b subunit [Ignavibacteria bacterium]
MKEQRDQIGSLGRFSVKEILWCKGKILYFSGTVTLLLLFNLILTGLLLFLYYKEGNSFAYESVEFISYKVRFGWLVRAIHYWSAVLLILSIAFHMFSMFFLRAYRKPREITWFTGALLLLLAVWFSYSGSVLPWNSKSLFMAQSSTEILKAAPLIGNTLADYLIGGNVITGQNLSFIYKVHILILPALFSFILYIHFSSIKRNGLFNPEIEYNSGDECKKKLPIYPNFSIRAFLLLIIVTDLLFILAVFSPVEIGIKADDMITAPQGTMPGWYFLFVLQLSKIIHLFAAEVNGKQIGITICICIGMVWFLAPLWDRISNKSKISTFQKYFGISVIILIFCLTIIACVADY